MSRSIVRIFLSISVLLWVVSVDSAPTLASILTVTNSTDSASGSLRAVLANAVDGDTIAFANPLDGGNTIRLTSTLVINQNNITIDATINGHNHGVVLDNASSQRGCASNIHGIQINGSGNTIKGLVIQNLNYGIFIFGSTATGNKVQNNYIGTNTTGLQALGNCYGVGIEGGASTNTIGGTTSDTRNLVSGNLSDGIRIAGTGASQNIVQGNFIGTDLTGTSGLGNQTGVLVYGATSNTIGGNTNGAGNLISGNTGAGIYLLSSRQVTIQGNLIGLDINGSQRIYNSPGVRLNDSSNNYIGGDITASRNIISGNAGGGILIESSPYSSVSGNVIQGNFIGTAIDGTTPLSNWGNGVTVTSGVGSLIFGNVIAFNDFAGVKIAYSAIRYRITGNSFFHNGSLGIDLADTLHDPFPITSGACNNSFGANYFYMQPTITGIEGVPGIYTLSGIGCPNATIELYIANPEEPPSWYADEYGEGKTLIAATIADDAGDWRFLNLNVGSCTWLTAIEIDNSGNTSEFSRNVKTPGCNYLYFPFIGKWR